MLCMLYYKYADTCKKHKIFVDIILPKKNNMLTKKNIKNGKGYVYW